MFNRGMLAVAMLNLAALPCPAQEVFIERPATCPPGCTIVEEVCYRDVCKKVCRILPDPRKHRLPVYDVKHVDICKLKCGCECGCDRQGHAGPAPSGCNKCRTIKRLVKRECEEEVCYYKCEVEMVVEQVPYKVYRQVPCDGAGELAR